MLLFDFAFFFPLSFDPGPCPARPVQHSGNLQSSQVERGLLAGEFTRPPLWHEALQI